MSTIDMTERGSARLLKAFEERGVVLSEDLVRGLAEALDGSEAKLGGAWVAPGTEPTGFGMSLAYDGEDLPRCGNDMQWLLELLRKYGTGGVPTIDVIINGRPRIDRALLLVSVGAIDPQAWDAIIPHTHFDRAEALNRVRARF